MKNFLRFIVFALLFSFFGCSGSVDENLYSSVSFEITIPESIGKQDSKIARNVSTENLKLVVSLEIEGLDKILSKEKNVSPGDTVTISFDELPVESNIRVKGELSNADEVLLYSGESEWQKILAGKNSVDLKMKKVITEDDTEGGDNTGEGDNTEGGDNTGEGGNTEGGGDNTGDGGNTEGGGDNTGEGDNTEGGDNTGEGDNTEGGDNTGEDDNTGESEEIINAANPSIITRPTNVDLLYGLDTENPVLQISAKSEDGGVVSFQWQVKNASGEWEDVESTTTENSTLFNCSLTVPLDSISLNETKSYKCIVTNTNETVNGIKTAFVEVPVEVSLKQGTVLSFTTAYSGTYELYGKEFGSSENKDYSSIKIVEYYTRPNGNQESRTITFDKTRYSITAVPNAVGYVPYTITNLTSKATSEVRVPVKYSLEKATVSILNSSGSSESCIAQYTGTEELTAKIEIPSSDSESNGILFYSSRETTTPSNFLINENVKVVWSAGTVGESQLSVVVDNTESKTYKATVTPKEDTSWCVGEIVSNEYSVTVEPWKIEINNSEFIDGKYVIDIAAEQCALLVTNNAYPEPTVTFESKNNKFNIVENVVHISTSENAIEDVIIAKVDNTVIGSISVILPGITNAAAPELVEDLESIELISPVATTDPVLDIVAMSTDGGVITFQWQVQNDSGEWEDVEATGTEQATSMYTSILTVPLSSFEINETKTYKCIVTNTNENANGTKTSSIEKEATIKYLEGSISGVTAKYDGDYELYGSEFLSSDSKTQDFSKIKITETYKSSSGKTGQRTVDFNQEDYTISDGKNAVGYVPYTIVYANKNLTADVRVPVKYKISSGEIQINHSSSGTVADDSGKIEFIKDSENCSLDVSFVIDSMKLQVYKTVDSTETEYYCDKNEVAVEWNQGTEVEGKPFAIFVDVSTVNEQTYTATISPKNDGWLVCDDDSISLSKIVSIIESSVITEPDGTQENPFTNWDQLVASVRNNQSVTAYITGDITASTSEIIVGGSSSTCIALVIIPVGNVTITRTGAYKMFDVQEGGTLSIVGNENEKITFDGANLTASDSMFGINNTSANFSYCDFKNTNLQDDGAVLYITDTAGNTCVNIGNCTFENNSNSDVYVQNCPSLILDGNVQIPSLYFRNEYDKSSLNIGIGNNLSGSVTIKADNYESLDVFDQGVALPDEVFSLADSNYIFNTDGSVSKVETPSITYAGMDSLTTLPVFYIYDADGLCTFRDIVNGTLESSINIPADPSVTNGAPYDTTNTQGISRVSGVLQADIDLGTNTLWVPITGSSDNPFCGDFDGNGKTISNLNILDATTENQGLFGVIDCTLAERTATIKNLKVSSTISCSSVNVGAIAGYAYQVNFINCESSGMIMTSASEVGGIVGYAEYCEFNSCVNKATVGSTTTSAGNASVGGIAGLIKAVKASNCFNSGSINGPTAVGGLFGYEANETTASTFDYCINSGSVIGTSLYGGILGYATTSSQFNYCANYGKLSSESESEFGCFIGGINSNINVTVTECLSVGAVYLENAKSYYAINQHANVSNSYYDSTVLSGCSEKTFVTTEGLPTGLGTTELIAGSSLENFTGSCWSYAAGRYPIPNVQSALSDYWNDIVSAATPTSN